MQQGRQITSQWIFGGICRQTTREFFLGTVDKRDCKTLLPLIKKRIKVGTTVISDCWKSYNTLNEHNFGHLTVNHKLNFVDPTTNVHTQNIKNLWWQIKRQLLETYT